MDRQDYILYGWPILDKLIDENTENGHLQLYREEDNTNELSLICCNSGNWFGVKVMKDSGEKHEGWGSQELVIPDDLHQHDKLLKQEYLSIFGSVPETEPKLLIFSDFR